MPLKQQHDKFITWGKTNVTAVDFYVAHSSSKKEKIKIHHTQGRVCKRSAVQKYKTRTHTSIIVILRQHIHNTHTGRGEGPWSSLMTSNHRHSNTWCDDLMAGCRSADLAWSRSRWMVSTVSRWSEVWTRSTQQIPACSALWKNIHDVRLSQLEN